MATLAQQLTTLETAVSDGKTAGEAWIVAVIKAAGHRGNPIRSGHGLVRELDRIAGASFNSTCVAANLAVDVLRNDAT